MSVVERILKQRKTQQLQRMAACLHAPDHLGNLLATIHTFFTDKGFLQAVQNNQSLETD